MSLNPLTRRPPSNAARHDVGDGTMLTVRQIAARVGTTTQNIRNRLNKGWTGESLLLPVGHRRNEGRPRTMTAVVGYTLALRFGTRLPSTKEIQEAWPMDDTTAMYWRNSIRIAIEKHNTPRTKR